MAPRIVSFEDWIGLHRLEDTYHGDFADRWHAPLQQAPRLEWIEDLIDFLDAAGGSACELRACLELWDGWLALKREERKARRVTGRVRYSGANPWCFARPQNRPQWAALYRRYGDTWDQQLFPMEPQDRPGFVYFLRAETGHFKIGKTREINNRVRALAIQLPFEVSVEHSIRTDDCHELERQYHVRFAHLRTNGEWFRLNREDLRLVRSYREQVLYWPPLSDHLDTHYLADSLRPMGRS